MAKLCAKGKAAAKRKFKVYPSAYANMYGSAVCSGKIKPGGKKKSKRENNGSRRFKKMGEGKMGRYRSAEEERQVSTLREIEGQQKEVSKMRPTCKSHSDDKVAKGECCCQKTCSPKHWP
jgi:hypothetical protein